MTIFSIICMAALAATGSGDSRDVPTVTTIVIADESGSEQKAVASATKVVERFLAVEGVKFDRISEEAVAQGGLGNRAVAVLPYNPNPSEEALAGLEKFVKRGGKLFVCYSLPKRLGTLLGFKPGKWQRGKRPGHFAEIRFDGGVGILGIPPSVKQASWNINAAEPAGHNARVVARWHDDRGNPSDEPAMLISDRGALLTHVVLGDDPQGKQKMLLAVLGRLAPSVWKQVCDARLEKINQVGHCRSFDELAGYIKNNGRPAKASGELRAAQKLLAKAKSQYKQKCYHDAVASIDKARELLDHAYLLAQPSPAVEARGWWCYPGTGPYPGDWDRALKELSESGFNMVFPNMLCGGAAHYPSDILPRSNIYDKYGDQIAQCLAAAKKHGVEMHVWKINYNLSHRAPKSFVDDLRRQGRIQASADGHPKGGQPKNWLCPSHPENIKLEADSMVEIVEKYDVDGIHFDYIRYPNSRQCYCDGCRKRFEADSGQKVENWPADCHKGPRRDEYRDWRARQITRLVAAVYERAKKVRKDVQVSAAVFSFYPQCRDYLGQDWVHWAKSGYVDFLCPMDYTNSDQNFRAMIKNQLRLLDDCVPIYPGIGAASSRSSLSAARVVGQVRCTRELGTGGFTIFNLTGSTIKKIGPGFGLGAGRQPATPSPHGQR